jgi:hypothetical protein
MYSGATRVPGMVVAKEAKDKKIERHFALGQPEQGTVGDGGSKQKLD